MVEYIIQEEDIVKLADIVRDKYSMDEIVFQFVCDRNKLALTSLPEGITSIGDYAFADCINLTSISLPGSITNINQNAFYNCTNLTTINVPWAENEVANAPWGATNATINYNYIG